MYNIELFNNLFYELLSRNFFFLYSDLFYFLKFEIGNKKKMIFVISDHIIEIGVCGTIFLISYG